jgi:hypothetical protein
MQDVMRKVSQGKVGRLAMAGALLGALAVSTLGGAAGSIAAGPSVGADKGTVLAATPCGGGRRNCSTSSTTYSVR